MRFFFIVSSLLCSFLLPVVSLLAQTNGSDQNRDEELRLALRVKQIDEFFERFNGEPSLALTYLEEHYPERMPIPREQHLWWLMDHSAKWDSLNRDQFLKDACDPQHPSLLSFYDKDWFAELDCQFRYKGNSYPGRMILHIQADRSFASKWVISSIEADFVPDSLDNFVPYPRLRTADKDKLIRPTNHVPHFTGLLRVFRDSCYISQYFSNRYTSASLFFLEEAVQKGDLEIEFVRNIRYHFLQMDNWIIVVEEFNRKEWNAGWLISQIIPASVADKKTYRRQYLNLH